MPTLRKRRSTAAAHADADDAIGGDSAANTNAGDGGGQLLLLQASGDANEATAKNETAIDEAEAALAAAKETRRAKAKKRRLEAKQRLPRFEVLIEQGLMPLVVDLLSDSPKGLFSLHCVSKRSKPFLTREVVVKSSVYCGGNSREIMRDLIQRIEKRSIFLPSADRMLRLINGRRCENLSDCWGYNIRTQKHANLATAHYTSRPFGLCICKDCVKGLTTSVPSSSVASSNDRVDDRTLDVPFCDSQGKRQGPVVTTRDIKQIEKSYRRADDRTSILNQILKEVDDEANDDEDAVIKSLVETHKDAESKANAFIDARRKIESLRYEAALGERTTKKLAKMKKLYEQLAKHLEDYEHKDLVLGIDIKESWIYADISFDSNLAEEMLSGLFSASSSANKKKIKAAAEEVKRVFNLAASKNLLRPLDGYLSCLSGSSDRIARALYSFATSDGTKRQELIFRTAEGNAEWLASNPTDSQILDRALKFKSGTSFASIFSLLAVPDGGVDNSDNLRELAKKIWDQQWYAETWTDGAWSSYHRESWGRPRDEVTREAVPLVLERFCRVRTKIAEYVIRSDVIAFIEEDQPNPNNPDQTLIRRQVVESIYKDTPRHTLLFNRNFLSLLNKHREMFQNPNRFRLLFQGM